MGREKGKRETARSGIEKEEERRVERLGSGREKERHYAFRTTPKPQPPSRTAAEKGECTQAWATAIKVHEWGSLRRHEAGQSRTERKQKEEKYETREERVGMGVGWDGVWVKGEIEKRKIETSCFRSTPRHLQPPSHTAAEKGEMQTWATALQVRERRHEAEQSRTEHKQKEEKHEKREERVGIRAELRSAWRITSLHLPRRLLLSGPHEQRESKAQRATRLGAARAENNETCFMYVARAAQALRARARERARAAYWGAATLLGRTLNLCVCVCVCVRVCVGRWMVRSGSTTRQMTCCDRRRSEEMGKSKECQRKRGV